MVNLYLLFCKKKDEQRINCRKTCLNNEELIGILNRCAINRLRAGHYKLAASLAREPKVRYCENGGTISKPRNIYSNANLIMIQKQYNESGSKKM